MKKKILVAVLALCAVVASPAFARQADNGDAPKKERDARKAGKRGADAPNPFEELNLTAEQQTKLKALKEECKARRKAQAEQRKEEKKARKDAVCKERAGQLAKIKEILSPEQYVKFLENSYLSGGNFDKKNRKGHRSDDNRGPHGQRPAHRPQVQN